jgi:hypothetical protein
MADKKKEHPTTTPSVPAPAAEVTPVPSTAMVKGDNGGAVAPYDGRAEMLAVAQAKETAITTIRGLLDKYQGAEREQLLQLLDSVNPDKEGLEETDAGFVVPVIRIVQNTTREVPEGCQKGDLFTNFGSKVEKPFRCIPLYEFRMNRMFPSKEEALGRPVCVAPDAKFGKPFGKCIECDNLPMKLSNSATPTDCDNVICFLVMSEQFRIYRVEFGKTSWNAGQKLDHMIRERAKIWDRWVSISTAMQRGDKADYWILTTSTGGQDTPQHLREGAAAFMGFIRAERQAFIRQHYATALQGQKKNTDENVDMEGLVGADGANPDLSTAGV